MEKPVPRHLREIHMIHFEGVQHFPQPVAEVAAKLSDAGFVAQCVPDVQVTQAETDHAVGKVKPKLSFLTGTITLEASVATREAGKMVTYEVLSKVIGASSTVVTKLEFQEAEGGGTAVRWTGDLVSVTGLMKMVPKGLMEGSAKKVIDDVWAAVAARLKAG